MTDIFIDTHINYIVHYRLIRLKNTILTIFEKLNSEDKFTLGEESII